MTMWTTSHMTVNSQVNEWSKSRKFLFVLCLTGFLYQIYTITRRHYRYDVEVHRVDSGSSGRSRDGQPPLELPALTLCTGSDVAYLKRSLYRDFPAIKQRIEEIDKQVNTTKIGRAHV